MAFLALFDLSSKQHLILVTTVFLKLLSFGFTDIYLFHHNFLESFVGSISVYLFVAESTENSTVYLSRPHGYAPAFQNGDILNCDHSSTPSPLPHGIPFLNEQYRHPCCCPVGSVPMASPAPPSPTFPTCGQSLRPTIGFTPSIFQIHLFLSLPVVPVLV